MRILTIHNRYKIRGGEEEAADSQDKLYKKHGHSVLRIDYDNDSIQLTNLGFTAARAVFNPESFRHIRRVLREFRPDVVNSRNFFPHVSPAVFYAAQAERLPIVQTLSNYRLVCPAATLQRNGRVCESCLRLPLALPGIFRKCYRGSTLGSASVALMSATHRLLGTWSSKITLYVAPSQFCKLKFVSAGFPAERIRVKPNFIDPDPQAGNGDGGYFLFVGRLAAEKGIRELLDAWQFQGNEQRLLIVGEGPLEHEVRLAAATNSSITYMGRQPLEKVYLLMGSAGFVVVPSFWHEPFGRAVMESFAKGTPVVGSNLGAIPGLINQGSDGLIFQTAAEGDLRNTLTLAAKIAGDEYRAMRISARKSYLENYTAAVVYPLEMAIFREAIACNRTKSCQTPQVADAGTTQA